MFAPLPFALHASGGCPPVAELALSLASSFHEVDPEPIDALFESLAERLGVPPAGPARQLRAVAALCEGCPELQSGAGVESGSLLLDCALPGESPHPLMVAVGLVEIGRRVGIPLGVVSDGREHCVAHTQLPQPLVIRAADGEVVDARRITSGDTLSWRCPHETCGLVIDELELRFERVGLLGEAIEAAQLRLCLPLDADEEQRSVIRLEQLRARLN